MQKKHIITLLRYSIAAVWLINGLYCKVLNGVPRHRDIVASILGSEYAAQLTILIGIAEIVMAIWIISQLFSKLNTAIQILIVTTMNLLEFFLVPHLLLWGKCNSIFAACFVGLILLHYLWTD
ncbi:MAG: DoxX-like family protein [Bacteroidetes bacterium]|nr:DoxX-like family protein [Bacteroidota bacterium]